MELTPVEWLHIEFQKRFPKETSEMYNNDQLVYEQMILEAKEMEHKKMEQLFNAGKNYGFDASSANEWGEDPTEPNFEEYIKLNFKTK